MRIPTPEEMRIKARNDSLNRLIAEISLSATKGYIIITDNMPDFVREYVLGSIKAVGYSVTECEHGHKISWMPEEVS